jgi:hypothetical protein
LVNNIVLIGANSEFAISYAEYLDNNSIDYYQVARKKMSNRNMNKQLIVKNYSDEIEEIINFLRGIDNLEIYFFHGFLAENRPHYYPSNHEMRKTIEINYSIPYEITMAIHNNLKVKKFIYISSMASVRPRFKNFIYGLSKQNLENTVKQINNLNYLIVRFGQIHTSMSKDHNIAPFSLSKQEASRRLFQIRNFNGLKYATKSLLITSTIVRVLPRKIIDYLEK